MLDITAIEAGGQYKQNESLQQAAHERLLRQLRPAVAHAPVARPARLGQLGSLLLVAAVLHVRAVAANAECPSSPGRP